MFTRKLKHLGLALIIAASSSLILTPALASADFQGDACSGLNSLDGTSSSTCSASSGNSLSSTLKTVISILSIIVGIVAVIMIIVGGLRFITSGGDSSATASARNTIIYALIGIVVAVLAQALVHFVLFRVSGGATCTYNSSIAASDPNCVAPKK